MRLNCLVHGLTVHTSFDMAPPYPKFVATTSMKHTGCVSLVILCFLFYVVFSLLKFFFSQVVLNSGNFLHVIRVELENVFESKSSAKSSHVAGHLQP